MKQEKYENSEPAYKTIITQACFSESFSWSIFT